MMKNKPKELTSEAFWKLQKESPNLLDRNLSRHEDLDGNNEEEAIKIINRGKDLGIFDYKGLKYKIYSESEGGYIFYYLIHVHEEHPMLLFHHQIKKKGLLKLKGVESVDIWQNHALRDFTNKLAVFWIFTYILNQYNFIMSDKLHTPLGKAFWIKLLGEAIRKQLGCIIYDINTRKYTKLVNLNSIDDAYSNQNKGHLRFIIFDK